jgi:parvulin-like peptidyl-prolyl isomerase
MYFPGLGAFSLSCLVVLLGLSADLVHAGDGDAIAIVNGRPLNKEEVVRLLMESHGVEALQQLVLLDLARQETKARGIRVTDGDVERERQRALDELAEKSGLGPDATQPNKEQALKTMLEEKQVSMAEYNLAMERNAHLRKLVESDLNITEATLRAEFARQHGERRGIRHVQIRIGEAKLLNQAVSEIRSGTDFADVSRRLSQNPESAPKGGELPPFAFDDAEIPAAMREQAFAMQIGETSNPIKTEQVFQILKLEKIIPPENARFEDVREELEKKMRSRASQQKMGDRMTELFNRANVNVLDGKLKRRYEDFVKESRNKNDKP